MDIYAKFILLSGGRYEENSHFPCTNPWESNYFLGVGTGKVITFQVLTPGQFIKYLRYFGHDFAEVHIRKVNGK